jgi:hypothetical protein
VDGVARVAVDGGSSSTVDQLPADQGSSRRSTTPSDAKCVLDASA